jgi:hypothetical protein
MILSISASLAMLNPEIAAGADLSLAAILLSD